MTGASPSNIRSFDTGVQPDKPVAVTSPPLRTSPMPSAAVIWPAIDPQASTESTEPALDAMAVPLSSVPTNPAPADLILDAKVFHRSQLRVAMLGV
jgi:hypothetical protein